MRKKWLASLLSLAMLLSLLPTAAFAVEPEEGGEVTVTETTDLSGAYLPGNDELLAGYVQQLMYPNYGVSLMANWGSSDGVLNTAEQAIYGQLKGKIEVVAATGGPTVFTVPAPDITWQTGSTGETLKQEAAEKFNAAVDTGKILDCLLVDCPYELYWFDKTEGAGVQWSYSISSDGSTASITSLTATLHVAQGYQDGNTTTVDGTRAAGAEAAAANARSIVNANRGLSDYERLEAYKDKICELVSYDDSAASGGAAYGDPWQLVNVFDPDPDTNVVCEGYAKAFQYLCDLSGLTCYTVTGTMRGGTGEGPHMWNIVTLDGANYLVDVTNCDEGTVGSPDKLFMVGAIDGTSSGYTISGVTYTYDSETKALYDDQILTLSWNDYAPSVASVTIGGETTNYTNINDALNAADGQTAVVRLLADAEITTFFPLIDTTDIIWEGGSYTLSTSGDSNTTTVLLSHGTFTLRSGTIKSGSGCPVEVDGGTFVMEGGSLEGAQQGLQIDSGVAELKDGAISSDDIYGVYVGANGDFTMSGGTVTCTGENGIAICMQNSEAAVTRISGGTIQATGAASNGLYVIGGTAAVSGGTFTGSQFGLQVNADAASNVTLSGGTFQGGSRGILISPTDGAQVGTMLAEGCGYQNTSDGAWIADVAVPSLAGPVRVAALTGLQGAQVTVSGNCTYTGIAQTPAVTVSKDGKTLSLGQDYTISYRQNGTAVTPINAGTYELVITGQGAYAGVISSTFTIDRANPDIGTVSCGSTAPIYESTVLSKIYLNRTNNAVAGTLSLDLNQTLTVGIKDYRWTFMPSDTNNYNTITGTVTLEVNADALMGISVSGTPAKTVYTYGEVFDLAGLTVTASYSSGNTKDVTGQVTFGALSVGQTSVHLSYQGKTCTVDGITVNKATYTGPITASLSAKYGTTGSINLSKLIIAGGVANIANVTDNDLVLSSSPTMSGGVLTVAFAADQDKVGRTVTVQVAVTSANYLDYTITVTATVADKLTPTVTVNDITCTYTGQTVPDSSITGTAVYNGQAVPGKWMWSTAGNTKLPTSVADSGAYYVSFIPDDTDTYTVVTGLVTVTINKATPTGAPGYTAINTSGKTLADANLTIGTFSVPGTVKWQDADTTQVTVNTSYTWIFTPTDTDNYNSVTGSIQPWHRSSSSSSSGTSGSKTEQNADGSTTTTVTQPNGTVTETTKNPDGSSEVVETRKDGTVTTTTTDKAGNKTEVVENANGSTKTTIDNKDGSSSTTTVSEDGQVEAQVKLPAAVVDDADGEAVALPMPQVPVTTDRESAPTITVDLPNNSSAKVEIPVRRVTAGTVAVLVKADGTEKVIKTSLTTDNGVSVTLDDGDTVKIVDNSKYFADVPGGYWGSDYIDFVASREIFSGTNQNIFSPEVPMNRAMIVTVLAALDGADTSSTGGAWYEAGQRWAMLNGISDGTNMEQNLTREQLAVMLWNYAGKPAAYSSLTGYPDWADTSSWATQAMAWAVEQGLISNLDGALAPQGTATRAQVATILMRFVETGNI